LPYYVPVGYDNVLRFEVETLQTPENELETYEICPKPKPIQKLHLQYTNRVEFWDISSFISIYKCKKNSEIVSCEGVYIGP